MKVRRECEIRQAGQILTLYGSGNATAATCSVYTCTRSRAGVGARQRFTSALGNAAAALKSLTARAKISSGQRRIEEERISPLYPTVGVREQRFLVLFLLIPLDCH